MAPPPAPNPYTRRSRRLNWARRAVAAALVAGALVLVGIYLFQRRQHPAPQAPLLGLQIQQSAAGVDITKSEGGRMQFRVHAARADKLRQGGVDELHQVHIWVYDHSGRHADEISGDAFRYDEASGELHAAGAVHITLERQLTLTAQGLTYNVKQGTGGIAHGVTFSMGGAQGAAGAVRMDSRAGTAEFSQGVRLDWRRTGSPDLTLSSDTAQLERLSGSPTEAAAGGRTANANAAARVLLRGHARLSQGAATLAAPELVAYVRPDYTLRHLEARGGVVATNAAAGGPLRVTAASGEADFTSAQSQKLAGLQLDGSVVAELTRRSPSGTLLQRRLRAGRLQLRFSATTGLLSAVQASQGAVLSQAGTEAERLTAPELDFTFAPGAHVEEGQKLPGLEAIASRGRTRIERGPLQADADQVRMQFDAGQQPRLALATGNVQVRQQVHGVARTSTCQRLEVHFTAPGPQIAQVRESGGVSLRTGGRHIEAQTLVYTPATGTAVFSGGVRGRDPEVRFQAAGGRWIQSPSGASRLYAQGTASAPVQLSLRASTHAAGASPSPTLAPMLRSARPAVISASNLEWDEPAGPPPAAGAFRGTAKFSGAVRLLQAPNLLRADQLTLQAGAGGASPTLEASGHVRTDFVVPAGQLPAAAAAPAAAHPPGSSRAVSIRAARLRYSSRAHQARYSGGVTLTVDTATLTAPQLVVYFSASASGGLESAVASGGVQMRQPGRRASGQRLSFVFARNRVQLAGGPPSIFDAEHGKITGDPLTFSLSNDEIQVGGKPGTRVSGRTGGHN